MAIVLFSHPFSSYCQKVLIALYEAGTPFETRLLSPDNPDAGATLQRLWPIGKFPMLVDEERDLHLPEASIIVEYLDMHYPGAAPMLPADPDLRLEVRLLDRFFDNYVMTPQQKTVFDRLCEPEQRDPFGVEKAHGEIETAYRWLDERMAGRTWAVGEAFTLADCAAGPALFYADWVHPIDDSFANLAAYRARLLARPSFARAIDEARPYRSFFPGGAPSDRG
ncbi:MAG: Glutathione S-transferase [Rhizorhabdus sp.]|nr:Glutathione S-transferase [Rhizorhabdus sp.]